MHSIHGWHRPNAEESQAVSENVVMPCSNMISFPNSTSLSLSFSFPPSYRMLGIQFILKWNIQEGRDLLFVCGNIMGLKSIYVCDNILNVLQLLFKRCRYNYRWSSPVQKQSAGINNKKTQLCYIVNIFSFLLMSIDFLNIITVWENNYWEIFTMWNMKCRSSTSIFLFIQRSWIQKVFQEQ